jgi:hypothetical protein
MHCRALARRIHRFAARDATAPRVFSCCDIARIAALVEPRASR